MQKVTIEFDWVEAQTLVDEWDQQALRHEGEAQVLRERIKRTEQQIAAIRGQVLAVKATVPAEGAKRPKGANLKTIINLFRAKPGSAFTYAQIVEATGIGTSSVQAAIKRNLSSFTRGADGLWRLKN